MISRDIFVHTHAQFGKKLKLQRRDQGIYNPLPIIYRSLPLGVTIVEGKGVNVSEQTVLD